MTRRKYHEYFCEEKNHYGCRCHAPALVRISHEIVERNKGVENVALVGIRTRGVPLANRLGKEIESIEGVKLPVGSLDITLYRDDLSTLGYNPVISETDIDFD